MVDQQIPAQIAKRDNWRNFLYIGRTYAILIVTTGATVWSYQQGHAGEYGLLYALCLTFLAVTIIGASQHQLGGAAHEAAHHILLRHRLMNDLVSDWLCMFPLYSSTYQYRIHHLAHHQYVNDPDRDPDLSQLEASGHWLDFPVPPGVFVWMLVKQLWPLNPVRYTLVRAKYNALGDFVNPYQTRDRRASAWPNRVLIAFALVPPFAEYWAATAVPVATVIAWLGAVALLLAIPDLRFPTTRIAPVISHRITAISRVTFMALLYGLLAWLNNTTQAPVWHYYLLLWVLPLFTSFAVFMILRQITQHGNGGRGRLTNTRVFLLNPLMRYAILPFGMDYHLPHHLYPSVPHYRLRKLHDALLKDPEYAAQGVIAEGYFLPPFREERRYPTVLEVLGPRYAASPNQSSHIDDSVLAECKLEADPPSQPV